MINSILNFSTQYADAKVSIPSWINVEGSWGVILLSAVAEVVDPKQVGIEYGTRFEKVVVKAFGRKKTIRGTINTKKIVDVIAEFKQNPKK